MIQAERSIHLAATQTSDLFYTCGGTREDLTEHLRMADVAHALWGQTAVPMLSLIRAMASATLVSLP